MFKLWLKACFNILTDWSGFRGDLLQIFEGLRWVLKYLASLLLRLTFIVTLPLSALLVMYLNREYENKVVPDESDI